ncbi:bifunctional aconitate hydratase 2/2-methylisocitrate dehydratase [Helicobacter ailurogastricus]|uniref:Aconitate hydratase B n=1 Tax=Helicobacter ailurogastricus TaxID=1578720 RepID=A0A0K2X3Q4_9HELI|nr:bifunctional aconitate hydratase 2/2-methylisocitrate dehydratase [Helicobacter ailurogastricus]CRF40842.1 Aconitate hydratase 2 [Helicobacter ailurogastricus]CRF42881.1 Aconitate hydratase 2 [Helicobacter ailurogastricus]CRF44053.1 Aconitate hydratase 2 [Helicobacter ailurogastricus]
MQTFIQEYQAALQERAKENIPPLPLSAKQVKSVVEILMHSQSNEECAFVKDLLIQRVSPGVDEGAQVKAEFLGKVALKKCACPHFSPLEAVRYLGTMLGGYNVSPLIEALQSTDTEVAKEACKALKSTLLVYNSFETIANLSKSNALAKEVLESWANAEWFLNKPALPEKLELCVLKIDGETNTDDLSPASDAFTRSDIPLHANAMLKNRIENTAERLEKAKSKGVPVVYVGDVVGTGSSRKSATNSIMWHFGQDIPYVPNKRTGSVVIGGVIAPIFFATCEDSGALPLVADVKDLHEGDIIQVYPYKGEIHKQGQVVSRFNLEPTTLADEFRAGGRIALIIGRGLTNKARKFLGLGASSVFASPKQPLDSNKGYTLAQKMVGRACGVAGVRPGAYCEPITTTVGSQDTTGAMTRDEVKELASLSFEADFVLQSFCHTAAYPKPADVRLQATLPQFFTSRGGVALKPKDGIIHSWLNRMGLPDTLGTGGDSHTRFPIGISFPAGSGLVAFAAVTGTMPLNMPESVLVRFKGQMQPGITLRDLVNAIPYYAIKQGLLTVEKKGKKNIFNGRILEIEGLGDIKIEQAFEFSDASAERSAAACTVRLNKEPIIEYLSSNIRLIEQMIESGYEHKETLQRRAAKMQEWINNPTLLEPDADAEYAAVIEIDLNEIKEPILACPNDPDDVATLSEVLNNPKRPQKIDEVFIGSCMTNIGHFRAFGEIVKGAGATPIRLWVVPPTKMDEQQLVKEGYFAIFGAAGARTEVPGCSLCMGNQARVRDNAVVFSTSTRNFDNRMGKGAQVYLGSAELGAVCALLGKIPTPKEYLDLVADKLNARKDEIYRYMNFHLMEKMAL